MDVLKWLLIVGAVSTILNFIMGIINTFLALRRTQMQHDLHHWKMKDHWKEKAREREQK